MNNPKAIAMRLIYEYKTINPFELCDFLCISVVCCDLPVNISGFYQLILNRKIIYINDNLSYARKKYICAHELGHSVMHSNYNSLFLINHSHFIINKFEKEANMFASALLLYEQELSPEHIMNLSKSSGIPADVINLYFGII